MQLRTSALVLVPALVLSACGDSTAPADGGGGSGTAGSPGAGGASAQGGSPVAMGGAGGGTTSMGGQAEGGTGPVNPWAGPVQSLKALDLGDVNVGSIKTFPIPDRTLGITALIEAPSDIYFGIASLRPPGGGGSVILNFEIPGTDFPVFADMRALTGGNPQSDLPSSFPILAGNWLLRVDADEGLDTIHERIFVRRTNDGAYHGGAVDFHVLIAPGSGVGQGYMDTVLADLFANYYTPLLGLTMGSVTYANVSSQYDFVDGDAEYRQMLATTASAGSAPAVNLFVVGDFGGDLDQALGVAGGVPASPMVHGTRRSGLAYTPTGNQGYDASVLAHEIGHVAGLFHTTEFATVAFDPLADTPQCPNINDIDPQNCPDVTNVMFPIAYGGSQLTALQTRVVHGSTLYRGKLDEQSPPSPPLLPAQESLAVLAVPDYVLPNAAAPSPDLTGIARVLHAHWCTMDGDVESKIAARMTASDRETALALAADPDTFDVARARAISLLVRTARTSEDGARLIAIARSVLASSTSGRRARVASLDALDALSPEDLSDAIDGAPATEDPIVRDRIAALGL